MGRPAHRSATIPIVENGSETGVGLARIFGGARRRGNGGKEIVYRIRSPGTTAARARSTGLPGLSERARRRSSPGEPDLTNNASMSGPFLQSIIAAIVWIVANVVYLDMRRKGIHGFTRFAAFWAGTPTTWITLFAVREGRQPSFEPQGDEELLQEIRRDRALRSGSEDDS